MYYFQIRLGKELVGFCGKLLRISLRTAEYSEARRIALRYLSWVSELNEQIRLTSKFEAFSRQLDFLHAETDDAALLRLDERVRLCGLLEKEFQHLMPFDGSLLTAAKIVLQKERNESLQLERQYRLTGEKSLPAKNLPPLLRVKSIAEAAKTRPPRIDLSKYGRQRVPSLPSKTWPAKSDERESAPIIVVPEQVAETVEPPAVTAPPSPPASEEASPKESASGEKAEKLLSAWVSEFLDSEEERLGHRGTDADIKPYADFWIKLLGDRPPTAYLQSDYAKLSRAATEVPNRTGLPSDVRNSIWERYNYARNNGWDGLKRLTETTIRDRYFTAFRRIFTFLITNDVCSGGDRPILRLIGEENLTPLPRDSFRDEEVEVLFSAPIFTGCAENSPWKAGNFFFQNHIYWGYLIHFLCGLRPSEIAQIRLKDIVEYKGQLYFDMRSFNPEEGRIQRKNAKKQKTSNAARLVPIPPLLVDLGLLTRGEELQKLGHVRFFPDWVPYLKSDGKIDWGRPLTRDWQNRRKHEPGLQRANISAYSARHSFGDGLDSKLIPERDRNRLFGHAQSVPGKYGNKGFLTPEMLKIVQEETSIVQKLRKILMGTKDHADRGELIRMKPWLDARPASDRKP